jgi:hypothetical protein
MDRHGLGRLPLDLQAMGWQWVSIASTETHHHGTTWYTAVYARSFERGIDDEALAHHHKGDVWVWVSTYAHKCASWDEAYRDAIALMRDADDRRWRPGQEP